MPLLCSESVLPCVKVMERNDWLNEWLDIWRVEINPRSNNLSERLV